MISAAFLKIVVATIGWSRDSFTIIITTSYTQDIERSIVCYSITESFFVHQVQGQNVLNIFFFRSINNLFYKKARVFQYLCNNLKKIYAIVFIFKNKQILSRYKTLKVIRGVRLELVTEKFFVHICLLTKYFKRNFVVQIKVLTF